MREPGSDLFGLLRDEVLGMKKLTGTALRDLIMSSRASFAESDWGPKANTEEKRLACVVRVLEVNLPLDDMIFDLAEAENIVTELLSRRESW